jgi:hypothetical protein
MAHSHLGCQSPRDYFTEQLLTILVCGALAFVGIQMYRDDMLRYILAPQFHAPVLFGSIAVLGLVALRAFAVWREAGELQPVDGMTCQENHVHTSACNHLPGFPTGTTPDATMMDDHGHSHDMAWVFARMLVLVFPIALFALGIPNSGFSADGQKQMIGNETALNLDPAVLEQLATDPEPKELETRTEADGTVVRLVLSVPTPEAPNGLKIRVTQPNGTKDKKLFKYILVPDKGNEMTFNELNDAAFDADKRTAYAGKTAILEGRFLRLGDKEFTLFRLKMTCCGADAVPLKVRIVAPQSVNGFNDHDWVRVKGVIQFIKLPGQDRYSPVIRVPDITDVQRAVVKNEYEL